MTTPRELVSQLVRRLGALEARVEELESAPIDPWDEPIEITDADVVITNADDDSIEVVIKAPTAEQREMREFLLPQIGLEHIPLLSQDEAEHAYIEGGPLWLYNYDREFLLSLPYPVRQAMVLDVDDVNTAAAADFGRDVMMDRGEQDQSNTIPLAVS